ncbi:hypothetical protein [Celerinatantimonas sp. MCCC 1A17872]|uniref:hypothetical protein n=1 Tax=Celerinatantimonas sp. MCCC 1A17872 TaxID=3177514 RepID=UPI0038BFEE1C
MVDLKEHKIEKNALTDLLDALSSGYGYSVSNFSKQSGFVAGSSTSENFKSFINSAYLKDKYDTYQDIPVFREIFGYEIVGTLVNFLLRGGVFDKCISNESEAYHLAKTCIKEIYGENMLSLTGYVSDTAWNECFEDEIIDDSLIVWCASRRLWWVLLITDKD